MFLLSLCLSVVWGTLTEREWTMARLKLCAISLAEVLGQNQLEKQKKRVSHLDIGLRALLPWWGRGDRTVS